jgi:hypothetical protein
MLSVHDEGYSNLSMLSVHDEGYSNFSMLSVHDEGYSRNASCALNLISTLVLGAIKPKGLNKIAKIRRENLQSSLQNGLMIVPLLPVAAGNVIRVLYHRLMYQTFMSLEII